MLCPNLQTLNILNPKPENLTSRAQKPCSPQAPPKRNTLKPSTLNPNHPLTPPNPLNHQPKILNPEAKTLNPKPTKVNTKKLETGLRTIRAGIPYTLLLSVEEAIGFLRLLL